MVDLTARATQLARSLLGRKGPIALPEETPLYLYYAGHTDTGRRREHNEDAYGLSAEANVFVVADGLGGYAAGEIASQLAVDTITGFLTAILKDDELTWPCARDKTLTPEENLLKSAIVLANDRIRQAAQDDQQYQGMSSTIVGLYFAGNRCIVGHVGDSRCYRLRAGTLERLTEDHSLMNAMKKSLGGEVDERTFPMRNIILRALGQKDRVKVDVQSTEVRTGDLFLLCTDGLTGELDDNGIQELAVRHAERPERLCRVLVDAACERGGRDNVTVLAIRAE